MVRKIVLAIIGVCFTVSIATANDTVMVFDSSGSMSNSQNKMKEAIKKALKQNVDAVGFGSYVYTISKANDYHLNGGTALSLAFETIDTKYPATRYVVLVTDGSPNSIPLTRASAKKLKDKNIKICSSFIGNGVLPEILKEISDLTFVSNIDLAISKCNNKKVKQKLLGAAVRKKIDINAFAF